MVEGQRVFVQSPDINKFSIDGNFISLDSSDSGVHLKVAFGCLTMEYFNSFACFDFGNILVISFKNIFFKSSFS